MNTIKNSKIFEELKKLPAHEKHRFMRKLAVEGYEGIPRLEKLDHIEETENSITFVDVGCEKSGGYYLDNTFEVVP